MGRVHTKHSAKWKVKENGKHVPGWWEDQIPANKAMDKERAKLEIRKECDSYDFRKSRSANIQ